MPAKRRRMKHGQSSRDKETVDLILLAIRKVPRHAYASLTRLLITSQKHLHIRPSLHAFSAVVRLDFGSKSSCRTRKASVLAQW
jgi:hypothetical protein